MICLCKGRTSTLSRKDETMLENYLVVLEYIEDCGTMTAGMKIFEVHRKASVPYEGEVGTVEGPCEVISITKIS